MSIGDRKVRILIPSRRRDGIRLDDDLRRKWDGEARSLLTKLFGGATAEPTVGTFAHADGRVTREDITVLTSVTTRTKLSREHFADVAVFSEALCGALGQESVLFFWGDRGYLAFTEDDHRNVRAVRFAELSDESRSHHVVLGWGGIDTPKRIVQILSLDGWASADEKKGYIEVAGALLCGRLAVDGAELRAWAWEGDLPRFKKALPGLTKAEGGAQPGDLVFLPGKAGETLQVLRLEGRGWAGPRDLAVSHGRMNPVTRELLYAILDRRWEDLSGLLRQKPLTTDFYPRLRTVQRAIEKSFEDQSRKDAFKLSILVVGRVMFLRFLAQKGWLPGGIEHLLALFESRTGSYYRTVLQPLCFDLLDRPEQERRKSHEKLVPGTVPYLDGGLFAPRTGETKLDLPDAIFDPAEEFGFLRLLRDYEFSLNEWAGSDESPKIDPALLGRILESFNNEHEIKKGGIHYTPKPIAAALAFEGIVSRLATATGLERDRVQRFVTGSRDALTGREAKRLRTSLETLRIIDPAVGSGALLWACLEALIVIDDACEAAVGGSIERGSIKWADRCRHFVSSCLFGVDLSEEAVELTRLRLWLTVAMSEAEATPLPDLELNIIQGDSLLLHQAHSGDSRKQTKLLGLDERDRLFEDYQSALREHREAVGDPQRQRELRIKVGALRRQLGEAGGARQAQELPLDWELSFADVFTGERRGFDLVIANPPYVRSREISDAVKKSYRAHWPTMGSGNTDLSYGFIELALTKLAAPKGGQIAFIQPSFGQNDAAAELRRFLNGERRDCPVRIDLWVDFEDQKVFPSALNYPALLFASRCPASDAGKGFIYTLAPPKAEWQTATDNGWLRSSREQHHHDPAEHWVFIPGGLRDRLEEIRRKARRRLGDICEVSVGIQTSKDDVFLFGEVHSAPGDLLQARTASGRVVELERAIVRRCLKGAAREERWLLFPYDRNGRLLTAEELKASFPKAWAYLSRHRKALEAREKGAFKGPGWYAFGRSQGFRECSLPKILIPATMNETRYVVDEAGELAFTASGKGGGGAWALMPLPGGPRLNALAEILDRPAIWDQILAYGSRQQGGWRGVDKALLEELLV